MKISKKFLKMSEIYKIFSYSWESLDFSDKALEEMYDWESKGIKIKNKNNGFLVGKQYMDVHIEMWRRDILEGLLFKFELYEDNKFPNWWLDKVL